MNIVGIAAMRPVEAPVGSLISNVMRLAVTGHAARRGRPPVPPHVTVRTWAHDRIEALARMPEGQAAVLTRETRDADRIPDLIDAARMPAIPDVVPIPARTIAARIRGLIGAARTLADRAVTAPIPADQTAAGLMRVAPVAIVPIGAARTVDPTRGRTAAVGTRAGLAIMALAATAAGISAVGITLSADTTSIVTAIDTIPIAAGSAT